MSLFKRKRRLEELKLPELPKLPDLPEFIQPLSRPKTEFPVYEKAELELPPLHQQGLPPLRFARPRMERLERPIIGVERERPLYVKIDEYKKAIEALDIIREKVQDAEHVLEKIDKLREEVGKEVVSWRVGLDKIRERLILIDSKLR